MNALALLVLLFLSLPTFASSPEPSVEAALADADGGTYEALRAANKHLENGRVTEAQAVLNRIKSAGSFDFWHRVLKAQTLLKQNQALSALELLHALPPQPDAGLSPTETFYRELYHRALQTKMEASRALGRSTSALESEIWGLFPDLSTATTASPDIRDRINRLHVLHEQKKFDEVPGILSDPSAITRLNDPALACRALGEWATSMRQLKRQEDALRGYTLVIAHGCPKDEQLARAYYWKGKIESNQKKTGSAIATYKEFLKHFPSGRYTDDAYHALAGLYRQNGSENEAKRMTEALMNLPQGDMKAKVLWDQAYAAYKEKDYRKAAALWDRASAQHGSHDETEPQALYWKARALEKAGDSSSKSAYRRVMENFPFSYYGVMAARRLGTVTSAPSLPPAPQDFGGSDLLRQVSQLNRKGLHAEAREVLDYHVQTHQDRAHTKDTAFAYYASGDYHRAMMLAHEILDTGPSSAVFDKNDPLVRLLFPIAYPAEVKQSSSAVGLPQGAVLGIMREESLFQVDVRSHAGALGLMQLMPGTATMQARQMGYDFDLGRVRDPKTNIKLGSAFFDKMVGDFGNHIPLAIMAYNAGPGNVRKWLKAKGSLPMDEFVEEIPFSETRGYIKRVLRSMQVYGHLCGDNRLEKPFFTMNLP